jgi:DNA mismatch repair protein MutL
MSHGPRIRQLDPIIAQRIAAGEVIDRPQAIVRELLDNAIDAGSTRIDVYIEDGGISSIKVIDDGTGMDREDLALCCRSHATSKISEVSDLYAIRTLGFRGEALASMAACSKMTIMSSPDREHTNTLTVTEGLIEEPVPGGYAKGTTIEVRDLFYSIPGRKNFLKSPQSM